MKEIYVDGEFKDISNGCHNDKNNGNHNDKKIMVTIITLITVKIKIILWQSKRKKHFKINYINKHYTSLFIKIKFCLI